MLALQIIACVITVISVWMIGKKLPAGPALNGVAALCFATINACADLWVISGFSVAMAVMNFRNAIRWRREARTVIMTLAALVLLLSAPPAFARHHRHHHRVVATVPAPSLFGSDVVSAARNEVGNGAIYGRSTLWCATFMNAVLRRTGYHGTGSDMAASFARIPHTSPHVGAIAVMSRRGGGHVGVVSGFDSAGNPIIISGNNAGRVREAAYPARRVYAYVVPQ